MTKALACAWAKDNIQVNAILRVIAQLA